MYKQNCIGLLFLQFLLVALFMSGCVTSSVDTPRRGVTQITEHVTDAGTNFVLAAMPDSEQVSIHIIWPNKWSHHNDLAVASTLGVDLISSGGAGKRSAEKITQDIIALQSTASLVAAPDHIYATFTANVRNLDATLDILRDVIATPELNDAQFNALKTALEKRTQQRQLKPSARLWSVARQSLIGNESLTRYWNNLPIEKVVTPLTLEQVKQWHKQTFTRQDINVIVAGPLEAEVVGIAIDRLLAPLPKAPTESIQPLKNQPSAIEPRKAHTVLMHDKTISTTLIAVIGLLPASSEGGEVEDIVAVSALGKGSDSRLVSAQKQQMPELAVINTSIANFSRDIRVFGISTEVENNKAPDALALIEETYKQFKQADLTDQTVLKASVTFANSLKETAQQADVITYGLGQLQLDKLPNELLLSLTEDTLTLKAADINQRITERYPEWGSLLKIIMSNEADGIAADCVVTTIEELEQCDLD